jgi:hypothetical protein
LFILLGGSVTSLTIFKTELCPEQYSRKPTQNHQPAASASSTLRLEFEVLGSKYSVKGTNPNLVTRNAADGVQQPKGLFTFRVVQ